MSLETLSFSEAFKDVTGGNHKVQTNEYLSKGKFPIVDQGKQLIAGYVDNEEMLCKAKKPSIIFGDHTKIIKFIDFDFVLGADGVKVLQPCEKLFPKYAYHYLKTVKFPEKTGYMRHFKYLKLIKILIPPLDEQKRIAAILDRASRVSESVAKARSMKPHIIRSIFLDMFGDMLTNTKNWPIVKLGNVCESQLGKAISREAKLCQSPSKYLRNANVQWRKVDITDLKEMDFKPKEKDKLKLRNGDVLATEGGDVGRCAIWSNGNTEIYFQNSLHRIRVDETILTAEYLVEYFAIMSERGGLIRETTQVTIAHLTGHKLKNLPLPLPPLHLQQKFIQKLNQIEKITSNFDLRTNEISQSIQQEMLT
jgi:type I restriction enzyme, S subunit